MTFLRKLFRRNHLFDMDKPVTRMHGDFAVTGYKCKRCGCVLYFEPEALHRLPDSKKFCYQDS